MTQSLTVDNLFHNWNFFIGHELNTPIDNDLLNKKIAAAARVLGNVTLYTSGEKRISEKERIAIETEIEKINKHEVESIKAANRRFEWFAKKIEVLRGIEESRKSVPSENEEKLKDKDLEEELQLKFNQILAARIAYLNFRINDCIPSLKPEQNYIVLPPITNERGLKLYVFVPENKDSGLSPIICCKGTDPSDQHNIIDDLSKNIGSYSMDKDLASFKTIEETLKTLSKEYGPVVVIGHSLGGAIAQQITAWFAGLSINDENKQSVIKATYHYNAPGVGSAVCELYQKELEKLKTHEIPKPKIYSLTHSGDLASIFGGQHLPTNLNYITGNPALLKLIISPRVEFKDIHLVPEPSQQEDDKQKIIHRIDEDTRLYLIIKRVAETLRMIFAYFVLPILKNEIENKGIQKNKVKILSLFVHLGLERRLRNINEFERLSNSSITIDQSTTNYTASETATQASTVNPVLA